MLSSRFTIVALALSAVCSSPSLAQESRSYAQCLALGNQGNASEAEPFCVKASEESKEGKVLYGTFLYMVRGDAGGAVQRYSEVLEGADLMKPTPTELTALRYRAMLRLQMGEWSGEGDLAAALKVVPNDQELLRVGAENSQSSRLRLEYAMKLVTLNPQSLEYRVLHSYALSRSGDGQAALTAAEAAIKLDPRSPLALTARAFAHVAMDDHTRAEKDHAAAARLAPKEPDPRANRAQALVILERYEDAIAAATEALALNPDHLAGLHARAMASLHLGRADEALVDIEKMNSLTSNNSPLQDEQRTAEAMLAAQKAFAAPAVAALEQDRKVVIAALENHMHAKCGYFDVENNPDNDALNAYRDCLKQWHKADADDDILDVLGPNGLAAGERMDKVQKQLKVAEQLQCSKMPKKARCVDDSLVARAKSALDLFGDPKAVVGDAEFARLNREVAAYNARAKRANALSATAGFLDAVANALSSQ